MIFAVGGDDDETGAMYWTAMGFLAINIYENQSTPRLFEE